MAGAGVLGILLGGPLLGSLGCVRLGTFPCERDSQCVLDGREGRCIDPGYCALPDDGCDGGYRYHERGVPDDLAGQCVPPPAADDTTTAASASGDGSSSDPLPSSSGEGSSSSSSTGSSSSDDGSSSTGSPCGDHPCPCTAVLAVGYNHNCVVRTDDRVLCWGANNQGQLGQGPGSGPLFELQEVTLPGESLPHALHTGHNQSCALVLDGRLVCWGDNNNGELTTPAMSPGGEIDPFTMPVPPGPSAVGMSNQHSCVGDPSGPTVRCLGNNVYDELGGGGGQPVEGAVPGMAPVDELALGVDHSCARAGGQVWCWGRDNHGQLGQNDVAGPTPNPTPVTLPGAASHLVAGVHHTCAALDGGTAVRCWGRGNEGQIGNGNTNNRQLPTALAMALPGAVVTLRAMNNATCALLDDGSLWCWGGNHGRWLGLDTTFSTPTLEPMPVLVLDELPEPIVDFGLGFRHVCARADSGRLWCWGNSDEWQLGPSNPSVGQAVEIDLECPAA